MILPRADALYAHAASELNEPQMVECSVTAGPCTRGHMTPGTYGPGEGTMGDSHPDQADRNTETVGQEELTRTSGRRRARERLPRLDEHLSPGSAK